MRRLSSLSVRTQMTLWSVGIVALALGLFGIGVRFGVERILMGRVDQQLMQRADRFDHHIPPPPHSPDGANPDKGSPLPDNDRPFREGPPPFDRVDREGGNRGRGDGRGLPREGPHGGGSGDPFPALVFHGSEGLSRNPMNPRPPWSREGLHLAANGRVRQGVFTNTTAGGPSDNRQHLRVYSRTLRTPEGEDRGDILQTAAPIDDVEGAVSGVTYALLLLVPAALLLTAGGALILADRALRPVGRLAEAAAHMEANNLSARLPGGEANDEFGRLTAVLNTMLARLEGAFERQRRFAADASHELRTPLATIKVNSSLALDEGEALTAAEARVSLEAIDRATDRAERLVRDLLLLARAGTLPMHPEVFAVREGLTEAVRFSRARVGSSTHAIVTVEASEVLSVRTDRDHLVRLVGNLLDNALRHTPPEGQVSVTAESRRDHLLITVKDTGEGIAPEHLARLGEPFYRADPARSRKSGGTGLGLAISHGLASALGGTLRLQSEPGHGTTATLTIPA